MISTKKNMKNKIFAALQTLGPSLTTGIAVIPLGGLLLGLSSILTNATFIEVLPFLSSDVVSAISTLFSNIGNLIIKNLAVIFALSVAMSYSRKDSIATFSALLTFMAMHTTIGQILNITAENTTDWTRYATVLEIPTLNIGVMGGILAGLVTAWVFNKFKDTKLPMAFSFFQGKRFVPIMSIIFGVIIAIPVSMIWPLLQNIIEGVAVSSTSSFSVWMMAGLSFLTFSLTPLGLHTFLFAAWAYQMGTYVSVSGNVVHGLLNIFFAQLADGVPLTTTVPLMGNYIVTGTLIGVVFAIIKEAIPSKKEETKSMFMGGIITNLFTGITEPLIFPFVFAAPLLYLLAVALMFLGELLVYFLNVTVGISFCGGLVDFLIYGVLQNANRWYLTPIISLSFGFLAFIIARLMIRKLHLNVPGQAGFVDVNEDKNNEQIVIKGSSADAIIEGLGGINNIIDIDACATRLRVQVEDTIKVNKSIFIATGASGIMNVGSNYQIVYGTNAPFLCEQIKAIITGTRLDTTIVEKAKDGEVFLESFVVPIDGEIILLSKINDKVFAEGMMGTGFGIIPENNDVYSPVNGRITTIFPTKHAIGLVSDEGKEVLIHIGIDTVKLKGEPFTLHVKEGDLVMENQKLVAVDFDEIKNKGFDSTVITVFTNIPGYNAVISKTGKVNHGEKDFITFKNK